MIGITRPAKVPGELSTRGNRARSTNSGMYTKYAAEYDAGTRTFSFRLDIYGAPDVKTALLAMQYGKCCFCETRIGADGDVEHFRPKAGVRQSASTPMERPGYYWLSYEWDNLLLSCGPCNQRFKRNLFPLSDPTHRARSHHDDIANEEPIFINPTKDNPEQMIAFRREVPYAISGNVRGNQTITALALDRVALNERRREFLGKMQLLKQWYIKAADRAEPEFAGLVEETRAMLESGVSDAGEYASMMRSAALRNYYL